MNPTHIVVRLCDGTIEETPITGDETFCLELVNELQDEEDEAGVFYAAFSLLPVFAEAFAEAA